MRIHYIQHVPFENPGYILHWAQERKIPITKTEIFQDEILPNPSDFDLLLLMGGPMGVYDTTLHSWLHSEKRYIEKVIRARKHLIGICLGAQLIAEVLGGYVYRNRYREIGWFPVQRVNTAHDITEHLIPSTFTPFHWHGDTFDIPDGALQLFRNDACANQGFRYQDRVYAFQFHLESTVATVELLLENCSTEIVEGPYIQSIDQIRRHYSLLPSLHDILRNFLNHLTEEIIKPHGVSG
jgi:GMP synthase-like glutamine amidotransferase